MLGEAKTYFLGGVFISLGLKYSKWENLKPILKIKWSQVTLRLIKKTNYNCSEFCLINIEQDVGRVSKTVSFIQKRKVPHFLRIMEVKGGQENCFF